MGRQKLMRRSPLAPSASQPTYNHYGRGVRPTTCETRLGHVHFILVRTIEAKSGQGLHRACTQPVRTCPAIYVVERERYGAT
jgi:hypothetical protein